VGWCSAELSLPERPQTVPAQRARPLHAQLKSMQLRQAGPILLDSDVPQVLTRLQMVVDAGELPG
jgi:hypothetical protein